MKRHFAILCLLIGLLLLTSCNLLAGQSAATDSLNIEPSALSADDQTDPASAEAPTGDALTPSDTPESEQAPEPQESQLPAPPVLEYIYPQNLISPLLAGSQVIISYIKMIDANNGWAVGGSDFEGDHILYTGDGGLTWTDVTPAEAQATRDIAGKSAVTFFQDDQTAWVAYYNLRGTTVPEQPVVWGTQDGGRSWMPSAVLNGMNAALFYAPVALWFDSSGVGWFLVEVDAGMSKSYAYLFQSLDGGYIWESIADPVTAPKEGSDGIQSCAKSEMAFADILNGWMLRECPGLFSFNFVDKTTDGGVNWNMVELPSVPDVDVAENGFCTPFDLNIFSAESVKVGLHCQDFSGEIPEDFYYLYSTTGGDTQWDIYNLPAMDAHFFNENLGWSLGRDMYKTVDGGQTWEQFKTVIWDGQFSLVDANNWWAVAHDGANIEVVYSSDAGVTWEIIEPVIGK